MHLLLLEPLTPTLPKKRSSGESERKGGSHTKVEESHPNKRLTPHNNLKAFSRVFNQHNQLRSLVVVQQEALLRVHMKR
jgi:hypothetical protein